MSMVEFLKKNISYKLFLPLMWGTLAGILNQGLNFITNIFLARFLGENFGELVLYQSTNIMLQTFSLVGLGTMATVLISKNLKYQEKEIVGRIISNSYIIVFFLSVICTIVIVLLESTSQNIISFWKFNSIIPFVYVILWFLFSSIDALQVAILIGFSAFKHIAIVSFFKGIISLIIILYLGFEFGVIGVLLGYAISFMISTYLNFYFLKINLRKNSISIILSIDLSLIWKIIKEGIPIFIAALFLSPIQWIINHSMFNKENGNLALALFGVANQWMILIQFFPLQISKVILPLLSGATKNRIQTEKTGLYLSLFIAFLLIFLSFLFDKQIIHLYGFDYLQAKNVFHIMLLSSLFSILNLYLGQTIIAAGKPWLRTSADFLIALSLLIVYYVIVNFHSIMLAIPIAYCSAFLIGSVIVLIFRIKVK